MGNLHRHDNSIKIPKTLTPHWVYKDIFGQRRKGKNVPVQLLCSVKEEFPQLPEKTIIIFLFLTVYMFETIFLSIL